MKLNIVPARTGLLWFALGFQTFMRQPLALAALVFMYSTITLVMFMVPLLGPFLAVASRPIGTLGLMAASKVAETHTFPMPHVLLTAFRASRERVRAMLMLGALYAACVLVLGLLVFWLVDIPAEGKQPAEVMALPQFRMAILWMAALYLPISLAFWHAPALVHWHGVPPVKSLFFSIVACVRNAGAFAMYALAWVAVMAVTVALSEVAALISPWLGGVVAGAISTIATIAFYVSIWFTFRDSFRDEEGNPGDSP